MVHTRASRVGDQIQAELASLLTRQVHDPGIGFLTITQVKLSPDLQQARVYYTSIGDDKAKRESARALDRATPFLRRQVGQRLRLKRVPELTFFYDESIEQGDRVERILQELKTERAARPDPGDDDTVGPRDDDQ
ncbi:MAG TPA: 30S ribosome-binding factor RbfA [Vicinamibacterales bacterium]|nr:30S ribosome-binding factor RbfA [Vicinamibacterales bacterium]